MKNLVYTVLAMFLLFFGLTNLTFTGDTAQSMFIFSWIGLVIFVIGGNLVHHLYFKKKRVVKLNNSFYRYSKKEKQRALH
ncbi:hypothetical protein ACFFIX_02290 [Metabacillus herbersteinensis]|uniref:Uncharacterized protein n=1 Tax=Metabacillus herbersteinensis TaxID=283816 RepID=A0ABV6G9D9_9BACI